MAWYALYKEDDGSLFAIQSSVNSGDLPEGIAFCPLNHRPAEGEYWDKNLHQFAARAPAKAELEPRLLDPYSVWLMWKTTLEEARARSLPAAVIAALQAKVDAVWDDYANAIQEWRSA
jgi:hypothetical protein